jgi:hypothetical protein
VSYELESRSYEAEFIACRDHQNRRTTLKRTVAVTPSNPARLSLLATSIVSTPNGTAISSTAACEKERTNKRAASLDCRHVKMAKLGWKEGPNTDIARLESKLNSLFSEVRDIKSTIDCIHREMVELGEQFGELKEYLE